MTKETMLAWIATASYEQLLRRWRSDPVGSPWFQGEVAKRFEERMVELRNANPDEAVRASKSIGW
jgi:phage terminase large subunit-like protein